MASREDTVVIPLRKEQYINQIAAEDLKEVEETLSMAISEGQGPVRDFSLRLLQAGGKRLRPLLILLTGYCFEPDRQSLIGAAAASEMIHMASLVHDDVIDEADSRRGQPTVNRLSGNHLAVLTGDFLFAKSFAILAQLRLTEVLDLMVEAIADMCAGEINQAAREFDFEQTMEDYCRRIAQKTSHLLTSCCRTGALIGGASPALEGVLGRFGVLFGQAFQIADDLLDLQGKKALGKPTWSDLGTGNFTAPIIYGLQQPTYGPLLKKSLSSTQHNEEQRTTVLSLLKKSGSLAYAHRLARTYQENARNLLATHLTESPYRNALMQLTESILPPGAGS